MAEADVATMKSMLLTKDTLVPLGIVAALVGGAVWLNDTLRGIDYRLEQIEERMTGVQEQVRGYDGIRGREMGLWIELLRARNPSVAVPDFPPATR